MHARVIEMVENDGGLKMLWKENRGGQNINNKILGMSLFLTF